MVGFKTVADAEDDLKLARETHAAAVALAKDAADYLASTRANAAAWTKANPLHPHKYTADVKAAEASLHHLGVRVGETAVEIGAAEDEVAAAKYRAKHGDPVIEYETPWQIKRGAGWR
jgi:hypothetical protein